MNYFKLFLQKLLRYNPKPKPLGRWKTESCDKKLNYKIYLSNIDNSYSSKN